MRVGTWNLGHGYGYRGRGDEQAAYLQALELDVVLLQEIAAPAFPHVVAREGGMARGGTWGSAVASWGVLLEAADQIANRWTKEPVELDRTVPGSVVVATADVSGTTVTYVSIYGAFEHGYSVTTVHRQLSDLVPLFDSQLGRNLIIGGDLNCSTQVEPPHRAWHRNLFERFASFGLVNLLEVTADRRAPLEGCWCEDDPCPHVQTHRHLGQEGSRPWHDDYLFATKPIAERLVDCQVVTEPDPWGLSDHAPVVATFEI